MPNDDNVVALPTGEKVSFPAGTDSATMESEIYKAFPKLMPAGSMQSFKGGPIVNSKNVIQKPDAPFTLPPVQQPSTLQSIGAGTRSFLGNAWDETKGMAKGAVNLVNDPIEDQPRAFIEKAIYNPAMAKGQSAIDAFKNKEYTKGTLGAAATLDPLAPDVTKLYEQSKTDTAGASGRGAIDILGLLAGRKVPDAPESLRTGAQSYLRIGPQLTKDAVSGWGKEVDAAVAKNAELRDSVNKGNAQTGADSQLRKQFLDSADKHTATIANKLPQVAKAAKDEVSQAYDALDIKGTKPAAEVAAKLDEAVQSKLQGSENTPPVVKRILGELQEQNPLNQASVFQGAGSAARGAGKGAGSLSELSPKAQAMLKANNPSLFEGERSMAGTPASPTGGLDFNKLQGYATEIGDAMQGTTGDVHAALTNARYGALEPLMREMAEAEGKTPQYLAAKDLAKKYHNTFNNTASTARGGSPIARALATKDPITGALRPDYVQAILADTKAHPIAMEMLDRYKHLGAPTNELEVLKADLDSASGIAKTPKWKSQPGEPKMPADVDPQQLKADAIKQIGEGMGSMKGIRGPLDMLAIVRAMGGNPEALAYPALRRLMGSSLRGEGLSNWLSKPTQADIDALKPMNAKKIALKQAQKGKP